MKIFISALRLNESLRITNSYQCTNSDKYSKKESYNIFIANDPIQVKSQLLELKIDFEGNGINVRNKIFKSYDNIKVLDSVINVEKNELVLACLNNEDKQEINVIDMKTRETLYIENGDEFKPGSKLASVKGNVKLLRIHT